MPVEDSFTRLLVVSNRGPLTIKKEKGDFKAERAVSGLVSAVEPVLNLTGGLWIAWCGRKGEGEGTADTWKIPGISSAYRVKEVMLSEEAYNSYYTGFSNECLWPLCHYFINRCTIDRGFWEHYLEVNRKFARAVAEEYREGDVVWVHDYHLMMVPSFLREYRPEARIAFFWHIPFPVYDIFRILPWSPRLMEGMLSCDVLAFHTNTYLENFKQCASRLSGAEIQNNGVFWNGREVKVQALPIGVDAQRFENLAYNPEVQRKSQDIRKSVGSGYLVIGVDRLDYTKGILERLQAIEMFLEEYPEYRGKFTFLQVAVPSRTEAEEYRELRKEVEEVVGRINGLYGEFWRVPVRYQFSSLNPEQLVALYLAADVALVTPVRDGLNLVAKEFVASRVDEEGVLVLSPFCGAVEELQGTLMANPYYVRDLVDKIHLSMEMKREDRTAIMKSLREKVKERDLKYWWSSILYSFPQPLEKTDFGKALPGRENT